MIENLIAVFAVLLTISFAAERFIEVGKPLFEKITSPTWQSSSKLLTAILIGTACAFLLEFNLFWKLGVASVANIVGYIAAGLIASTGSTTINRLLEWLKTLRNDTTTTVTQTTVAPKVTTVIVAETSTQSAKVPVSDAIQNTIDATNKIAAG